jgi:AcrR family transcriptional regulator
MAPSRAFGTTRSRRAEEILDEAMRLFAERGYAGTSVGDVQLAAGMTPGSGALYKHFPSKRALLEAGVDRFIAEGAAAATELPDPADADLETLVRAVGARVLHALEQDEATMRVVWRDLPAFPDLRRRFVDARLQFGFAQLARWLEGLDEAGRADVDDPLATAAVLLGSLAFFRVMETMLGETPGRVGDERFLDAWAKAAARAIAPSPGGGADGRAR